MIALAISDVERFHSYSDPVPQADGCRYWHGTVRNDKMGYGCFWLNGKLESAHRVAYVLAYGPIPDGVHVLHRCDHPLCVEPTHLWLGTNDDNVADKVAKGRDVKGRSFKGAPIYPGQKGEDHWKARLTVEQVQAIARRRAGGETLRALAGEFGISQTHVSEIARGETWEGVERPESAALDQWKVARGARLPQTKLTESQVREIRQRAANGEPQSKIAADYGVKQQAVFKIVHRTNWKHVV